MTEVRTLDVSHLPPYSVSTQSPTWWGQLCIALIEGTMFCILIAGYFYTRMNVDVWPPPGDQFPHIRLATLELVLLILSCLGSYIASEAAKKNDRGRVIFGILVNLILAGAALAMRIVVGTRSTSLGKPMLLVPTYGRSWDCIVSTMWPTSASRQCCLS